MHVFRLSIANMVGVYALGLAMSVGGCKTDSNPSKSSAPALSKNTKITLPAVGRSAKPEPTVSAAPVPVERVKAAVNPSNSPPYEGPTGAVEGTVRMAGDEPPEVPLRLPPSCTGAKRTYGRLFREGAKRAAADVLVAVTGYDGYVPEKDEAVKLTISDCAYSVRTVAMTFGQRLEVRNLDDKNSFIPVLQGARYTAFMVAVPKGDPVKLYPHRVGQYDLVDNMNRRWMSADVFALKYATHDVTGFDGRYRIEGIPVGEVKVHAMQPQVNLTAHEKVTVKEGETVKVDFVLTFDEDAYDGKTRPRKPAPSGSGPKIPLVK